MKDLLLEIGTEEIPAGYILPALDALSLGLLKRLDDNRIKHGKTESFGTPKRLAVRVFDVESKQTPIKTEVTGPPESIGFDDKGQPTVAAIKFAEKAGMPVSKLSFTQTKKGRYLSAVKTESGQPSAALLKTILPETIRSLSFPKTMRWADLSIGFARPVHSVLALLGSKVVSFDLENIKSGRHIFGHPFMSPGKIKVPATENYEPLLKKAYVIPNIRERRESVKKEIQNAAKKLGGSIMTDEELVDTVTNLVEYPVPVVGRFEDRFLELPDEVLITAMREHQKYFAVTNAKGKLMPGFIAVNNTRAKDMKLVAKGHERVLRARLEDARFFYNSDTAVNFDDWVEKLKGVTFQKKLGSVYDKVLRVKKLTEFLADSTGKTSESKKHAKRAAWLCKADLVSQVVVEFPKLQGIMGRIYAQKSGEPQSVAAAIEEHYLPISSGGRLPGTREGSIIAIADKMDTICGCFSAGIIPTGASDPYALRRQGLGIVRIMIENNFTFSLTEVIRKSANLFADGNQAKDSKPEKNKVDADKTFKKVYDFLKNRLDHVLSESGFRKDVINSVTSLSIDHVPNAKRRVLALENLKTQKDFEVLATSFKRVVNIIKKSKGYTIKGVDTDLFQEKSELNLFESFKEVKTRVENNLQKDDFQKALMDIASLRNSVDNFFDDVLVMDKNKALRNNRFALLSEIAGLFEKIADFSKIQTGKI